MPPPPRRRPSALPIGLGPHCVGVRVVVRRRLPGETGPTGGPALTDVLGVMEAWDHASTTIRTEAGQRVTIEVGDIVSGKPVPPRPSVLSRLSAAEVERRAMAGWPPQECEALGDWTLRAAGGFSARANSVLAVGDPGRRVGEALEQVARFYRERGLPAWAQVVLGTPEADALAEAGWTPARPGEADSLFQTGSVARARRTSINSALPTATTVEVAPTASTRWLAGEARGQLAAARAVLEGPAEVGFLSLIEAGELVARGRVAVTAHGAEAWAGITDVWVSPERRGAGLSAVVMAELLAWSAEHGAGTAYLQVRADNVAALALHARLGFVTHHTYRYLAVPKAAST